MCRTLKKRKSTLNISVMKKNILTTVLLTTLFFQAHGQIQNQLLDIPVSFNLEMAHETIENKGANSDLEAAPERCVILEYVLVAIPAQKSSGYTYAPKFLSSVYLYSFSRSNSILSTKSAPSSEALTFNNSTENTFFPWLNSVDHGNRDLHSQQHIPKGFGPLFSI